MTEALPTGYLAELPEDQRDVLARANRVGLVAFHQYLAAGQAMAFLGAGASSPLYPLWDALIAQLLSAASDRLTESQVATCKALAAENPEEVVEILRRSLGTVTYWEVLREVLRVRTDPGSGQTWTPVQEVVCRCPFKAVITTNYDPGIVDARMRVRPGASATGFTTWRDDLGLDQWRTGDVFGDAELPVLYAHGTHNQPESVVLATTEYRRAYEGKLARVLARLVDGGHLIWIGFSFADQRVTAILREVAQWSGIPMDPGMAPRHVAIMPWDPAREANDPEILTQRAEIRYGARLVLYPAPHGDHSALFLLLSEFTDPRFSAAGDLPIEAGTSRRETAVGRSVAMTWVHGAEAVEHFTGRTEELARLDRWAADPQVCLVGVTAWGGAGKTALVTEWVHRGGASERANLRGVFGWSFYADSSAENWASELLAWAALHFGIEVTGKRPAQAVIELLQAVPLLLVLDGLEVVQEGPAGAGFGRLLDGVMREVLTAVCRFQVPGMVLLTSRFPFADLEGFDGGTARMLDVPPLTPAEGSRFLALAGGAWLGDRERRELVSAVDGHGLAIGVLAGALAERPSTSELETLHGELAAAARTGARVNRVLQFYAKRLSEPHKYLIAAVSLFARPVAARAILVVARHDVFGGRLAGWTESRVIAEAQHRLRGLLSVHPDQAISAHPLVRDAFRPFALGAAQEVAETLLSGVPAGAIGTRADGLQVVEIIELLVDADQWDAADRLYRDRTDDGKVFYRLPAARLGLRAVNAFVATSARRDACAARLSEQRCNSYVNDAGIFAVDVGDIVAAQEYLALAVQHRRKNGSPSKEKNYGSANSAVNLTINLINLADCLTDLGEIDRAREALVEALACSGRRPDILEQGHERIDLWREHATCHVLLARLATISGDPAEAERQFAFADQVASGCELAGRHSYSLPGNGLAVDWADWLLHTGRITSALKLTQANQEACEREGWQDDVARCDRVLGRIALATGDTGSAGDRLAAAAACFRDGDLVVDLADVLVDQAEYARLIEDLDTAERYAGEAITIAAPRRLLPAHSAGLAARARVSADRANAAATGSNEVARGRDAADAALRIAVHHQLAWCELDALRAHGLLDQADGSDHGWATRAEALRARLIPQALDPDPLATLERLSPVIWDEDYDRWVRRWDEDEVEGSS